VSYVKLKNRDAPIRQFIQLKSLDADFAARLYKAIFSDKVVDARSLARVPGVRQ
jgi:hypothetical protein